jgi:hypothetical protein
MRKIPIVTIAALAVAAGGAAAVTPDVTLFSWLHIEPGVRPGGLGKSFTGLADDVNASFYNPGGLSLLEKNGITVMHEPRGVGELNDIFYDYVAFSYKAGKYGTFGADLIYSDAGKSVITDEQNNEYGFMHSYGTAPSLFWSYPLTANVGVGAGVTYVYEHLTDFPGGVNDQLLGNAGVLYKTPLKGLSGGLAFTNVGPNQTGTRINEKKQQEEVVSWPPPRTMRLGVGYKILSSDLNDLTAVVDGSKLLMNLGDGLERELGQAVYSGGGEYIYAKMVAVRAGYYRDKDGEINGLTLGFGFAYKYLSFDYARVPEGEAFGDRHRFAVGYLF